VSDIAEHVVAIDACNRIGPAIERPCNFELVLADGCGIAVPSGSIDVAFSNQVIEHLRPEDAREHLRNIFRILAPGGTYVCITPNRLYGQHDASGCFDEVATGVHLREYSAREIRELLLGAGFEHVDFYFGARGWFARCPEWIMAGLEALLDALPAAGDEGHVGAGGGQRAGGGGADPRGGAGDDSEPLTHRRGPSPRAPSAAAGAASRTRGGARGRR